MDKKFRALFQRFMALSRHQLNRVPVTAAEGENDVWDESIGTSRSSEARKNSAATLRRLRAELRAETERLRQLDAERAKLLDERRALQRELGERQGKSVLPRLKVEKTNGSPSLAIGARMMQRIFNGADEHDQPVDSVASTLADPAGMQAFAASHAVPTTTSSGRDKTKPVVRVHAFHGIVGLVETYRDGKVRYFDAEGIDPGEIRTAAPYDPSIEKPEHFEAICHQTAVLSANIPRPYVQVCWRVNELRAGVVSIDVDPERVPILVEEWDSRLGRLFDTGHARMLLQAYRAGALDNRVPGGTFPPRSSDD